MPFWLRAWMSPRNHVRWGPDPAWERVIIRGKKGRPVAKYSDILPWAVQKWLNRSICHLGCGLGWAKGSTSLIVFARWHQLAQASKYGWTVHLWQQCGLISIYFDHVLLLQDHHGHQSQQGRSLGTPYNTALVYLSAMGSGFASLASSAFLPA